MYIRQTAIALVAALTAAATATMACNIFGTADDRAVLTTLYEATNGDEWRNNGGWLSDKPLGEWHGVTTDERGRVVELALFENRLSGSIPTEIGNLTKLSVLSLRDNRLSGSIPTEIGNLTKLSALTLRDNRLSGSIPTEIGNLTKLTRLHLASNDLSGSIPPEIGKLTKLTELWLWDNDLSGNIPPEIGKLTDLSDLYLNGNDLSGNIPPEIGKLTNLSVFYLAGNRLIGCVPDPLPSVATNDLDELNLPDCGSASSVDEDRVDQPAIIRDSDENLLLLALRHLIV